MITARWQTRRSANRRQSQQGFSLIEALVAMLLLAMTLSALLQYHQALTQNFGQQWQQRQAWRVAAQALLGHEVAGWEIQRQQQPVTTGCELEQVTVRGPQHSGASLARLNCHSDDRRNRHPLRYKVE